MLTISAIEFTKSVYDESLSHQVFSVANITFKNYEPIHGALLFWQENKNEKSFTDEDEYKFFYDVSQTKYYASVKFPKYCRLTRDQKQELAYILLEQRGCIGSYSFMTNKASANVFKVHQLFKKLQFPAQFDTAHFKTIFNAQYDNEVEMLQNTYPFYTQEFIQNYVNWTQLLCQAHPDQFKRYLPYVQMTQICYQNPYLTENFIIDHLDRIDFTTLQYNTPVLDRLSKSLRKHLMSELLKQNIAATALQNDLHENGARFIEDLDFYVADREFYLEQEEDEQLVFGPFLFFDYDRGRNKWSGSEHLIQSIPSFACQLYNKYGERNLTNKEMDERLSTMNTTQRHLFITSCDLHWLNRYKKQIDWSAVCELNPNLTDEFIEKHLEFVDFKALANNTQCELSTSFIEKYFANLSKNAVSPLILRSLTEEMFNKHGQNLKLSKNMLYEYEHILPVEQFDLLETLFEL